MKKEIITIGIFIFLIGVISAYYPGESFYINNQLKTTNLNYSIIDNSTKIEGLDFDIGTNRIKITLPTDLPPGSFSILFTSKETHQQMKIKVKPPYRYYSWYNYNRFYNSRRNWFNYYWWRRY